MCVHLLSYPKSLLTCDAELPSYLCGLYDPKTAVFTCGTKDFMAVF